MLTAARARAARQAQLKRQAFYQRLHGPTADEPQR